MARITDITEQVKDKLRCNIYIDCRFYCGLKLETVMRYRLKTGREISFEELAEIQLESEKSEALDKALNYISATMKTESEIRKYLFKKGYLPAVSDYVVEKMKSYGYVDDSQYGIAYAKSLSAFKGKRLIELKLKQKGVDDESISSALKDIDESDAAVSVLKKYMKNKEVNKENLFKAFKYLMGKGFEYDTAKSAIEQLKDYEDL